MSVSVRSEVLSIAIVGNPNSGKSSLFNQLTGLHQHVGNYPGVTVDKKSGIFQFESVKVSVTDLPGIYSIYPRSDDEKVVINILTNPSDQSYPDLCIVVVDATNLSRNLLLFTEIKDLGIPVILALNMIDIAEKKGIQINSIELGNYLSCEVIPINARTGFQIDLLKKAIVSNKRDSKEPFIDTKAFSPSMIQEIQEHFGLQTSYLAYQYAQQSEKLDHLSVDEKSFVDIEKKEHVYTPLENQAKETIQRYLQIEKIVSLTVVKNVISKQRISKIDQLLIHPIIGFVLFFILLAFIFQSVFSWAEPLMNLIERLFLVFSTSATQILPKSWFSDLIIDGLIPGVGGVLVFIPQIAILFGFIAILEESGYMARAAFLMDKLMRKVGLNGKSVVPMISGFACAVPAIMAARTIENWKERIITIFVVPFMSCSARLPVYAIITSVIIPPVYYFGWISARGLIFFGLYLLGIIGAIGTSYVMKVIVKEKNVSLFMMEIPPLRWPKWKNIFFEMYLKVKTFVISAGSIILIIAVVIWFLSSVSLDKRFWNADQFVEEEKMESFKLELSVIGQMGKTIEPVIEPLGFDWKIGIALITSFAAREVFVGTIATLYSISDPEDLETLTVTLSKQLNSDGQLVYNMGSGMALLVFYVFSMQCMSTLAVVKRETGGWFWPIVQFLFMTIFAYFMAWLAFIIFS